MTLDSIRIGLGWDRHRMVPGRPFIIGGIEIPHDHGPQGHSDGDILLHAAMDAVLGASGDDDIGTLFPDDDPEYEGVSSSELTQKVMRRVTARGFRVLSMDAVLIVERPRIAPFRSEIRDSLAALFNVGRDRVNVKAKTAEGIGPEGEGLVVEASVATLLQST